MGAGDLIVGILYWSILPVQISNLGTWGKNTAVLFVLHNTETTK
jgi:hypothetical protein